VYVYLHPLVFIMDPGTEETAPAPTFTAVELQYCPVCTFPVEYCEFGPNFELCKPWIAAHCPEIYPTLAEEFAK